MITYIKGDMFESPAKVIVNTVNTDGVMGKGVALEFKKRYPDMYLYYKSICENKSLTVGKLALWKDSEKWVLMFPTKIHWRNPSKLEYIESGLKKLSEYWDKIGTNTMAFPRLGCGNGGLDWADVRPLMEKYLCKIPMQIYIYVDNYSDPKPEYSEISEVEKWIAGEEGVDGYSKFRMKLHNIISRNDTVSLGSGKYRVNDDNGVLTIDDTEVNDHDLCLFWNWIRDAGIIPNKDIPEEYREISDVIMELMRGIGYLSTIIVSRNGMDFPTVPNAYQYIAE